MIRFHTKDVNPCFEFPMQKASHIHKPLGAADLKRRLAVINSTC